MTIGDLIDQLSIANIRLWHIEDARREYCKSEEKDESKARNYLDMIANVNKERNDLIDQINASLGALIKGSLNFTGEDLLGLGKNKFYARGKDL